MTAAGVINRELVVFDKNEWIKEHVSPTVVVTCTVSGSQKGMFAIKGSVLIDDRKQNDKQDEDTGGQVEPALNTVQSTVQLGEHGGVFQDSMVRHDFGLRWWALRVGPPAWRTDPY